MISYIVARNKRKCSNLKIGLEAGTWQCLQS